MREIKISIRNLVEFIMRHGSIDNRYVGSVRAVEGTRAHQKIQRGYKDNYKAEFPLKYEIVEEDIKIIVEGRADGILSEDDDFIIDEIKTTVRDLASIDEDFNPLHWAQAKCYGYIYCLQNELSEIYIQITYYNIETDETKFLRNKYTFDELKNFFFDLIDKYKEWAEIQKQWENLRDETIKWLTFPFNEYRRGQRDFAVRVYKSITDGKKCFAQAPTGIGKTVSTLFPAIKALGEGHSSKLFYLTAKTITREVAENTIEAMRNKGLKLKAVTITAKDKVCFMEESNCNPEYCPYANGYYDRINEALKLILKEKGDYTREIIEKFAKDYQLCPFELALDLTLWSDAIVCDYNYVFDPKVYLRRFFENKTTDFTFLIDEAHNLVDRGREMFSATLNKSDVMNLKKELKEKDKRLYKALNNINSYFVEKKKACEPEGIIIEKEEPLELYTFLRVFLERADEYLSENQDDSEELLKFYFDAYSFMSIGDLYNEKYVTFTEKNYDDTRIKLYCVDPSELLQGAMKRGKASVIFSATLLPLPYFQDILGGNSEDYLVNLTSPFNIDNRLLLIADNVSTTYTKREESLDDIVDYIILTAKSKIGNYMVFFPSYKYMEMVYESFLERETGLTSKIQGSSMTEEEKEEFLGAFKNDPEESYIGFCVLGGHFSEGIDLTYDRLIGVIIVGVGMPQIGIDRDIIKDYFNEKEGTGFDYAYTYPGMIKVLQAVGRCIRTEEDKGVIVLIDTRYGQRRYTQLFPAEWRNNNKVRSTEEAATLMKNFWDRIE
ncbi:ATP-dependent DNA helicase [Clostridium cellulovorans]|uniref:DNA 5'-3' helicase n=1 Tax=Clostridium cellulovorans (strain ATCC 35296 / DSM 3052 / OCM 3 / 743B) TaxID=573061 RepID=D9SRR0_CLOC7|nr:ATP-dependent DNA helicase [Clostridium cellulovorans]ADL50427.1 helicase c2 [Clostridium cellulovorans 743B]